MIEATQTEWKQLSVSEIADFLKTAWNLSNPESRDKVQQCLDFLLLGSSADAEGVVLDVGGRRREISFEVLRALGFDVSRPDASRVDALANALGDAMLSLQGRS